MDESISEKNYEFVATEFIPYKNRMLKNVAYLLILIMIITAFVHDWEISLMVGALFLGIQYYKLDSSERYYVISLTIKDKTLSIEYWDRNQKKILEGSTEDFVLRKSQAFSRTRVPYLVVYYKKKIIIEQYRQQNEWGENRFDEIIQKGKEYGCPSYM